MLKKCKYCGTEIKELYKYCSECNKVHPLPKQRAAWMANQYPEKVSILYECPCESDKKMKHHFDYTQPFDVYLVCKFCHGWFHRMINKYSFKHGRR